MDPKDTQAPKLESVNVILYEKKISTNSKYAKICVMRPWTSSQMEDSN